MKSLKRTRSKSLKRSKKYKKYSNRRKQVPTKNKKTKSKRKRSRRSKRNKHNKQKGGFTHFYIPELVLDGYGKIPETKIPESVGKFIDEKC